MVQKIYNSPYPLVPYPHTYIALYSRTPKLPVTQTHTHKNKKLLSIPLKLVPLLAKLPSLVTPFPLGVAPPTPNTSHSSFWCHQSNNSVLPLLTFVCLPIVYGTKVTCVYDSLMESSCNNFMTYSEIKRNLYTFF